MLVTGTYEKCRKYIIEHSSESEVKKTIYPCVTISRQTGAGSYEVSEYLINILNDKTKGAESRWTYFNRELLEKLLEEFNLPKVFTKYIPEDKYHHINDAVNEILGVAPSEWTVVHRSVEIILKLAKYGKSIIVGRGSSIITSRLPNCFHIRLVAPIEKRIEHVQDVFGFVKNEALDYIKREDERRTKYLKSHFFHNPCDEYIYHLIINTGKVSYSEAANLVAAALFRKFPNNFNQAI